MKLVFQQRNSSGSPSNNELCCRIVRPRETILDPDVCNTPSCTADRCRFSDRSHLLETGGPGGFRIHDLRINKFVDTSPRLTQSVPCNPVTSGVCGILIPLGNGASHRIPTRSFAKWFAEFAKV